MVGSASLLDSWVNAITGCMRALRHMSVMPRMLDAEPIARARRPSVTRALNAVLMAEAAAAGTLPSVLPVTAADGVWSEAAASQRAVGKLYVTVVAAENLWPKDRGGSSDPYCKITVAGSMQQTSVVPKELNPVWNQTLEFSFDRGSRCDGGARSWGVAVCACVSVSTVVSIPRCVVVLVTAVACVGCRSDVCVCVDRSQYPSLHCHRRVWHRSTASLQVLDRRSV
jgi:hypothetical protein